MSAGLAERRPCAFVPVFVPFLFVISLCHRRNNLVGICRDVDSHLDSMFLEIYIVVKRSTHFCFLSFP